MLSFMHSVNKQHIDIPKYGKHGKGRQRVKGGFGRKYRTKRLLPVLVTFAAAETKKKNAEKEGEKRQRDR